MSLLDNAMVNISAEGGEPSYVRATAIVAIMPKGDGDYDRSRGFLSSIELSNGTRYSAPLTVEQILERITAAYKIAAQHDG